MFKKNINKNLKFSIYLVITIIITLGFSISIQSLLATWTAPTASPPEGNISGLLNEGINNQTKLGGLTIGGAFKADSIDNTLVVDATNNRVGIGTSNPSQKLDVAGYVKGQSGLCISNDCRTSWPSGGSSLWSENGSKIYYNTDNVGIGDSTPAQKLEVAGNIQASKMIDRDSTGYYVDPSSTSKFKTINLGGVSKSSWPSGGGGGVSDVYIDYGDCYKKLCSGMSYIECSQGYLVVGRYCDQNCPGNCGTAIRCCKLKVIK